MGRGIEVVFLAIAAALLPAGAVVLLVARLRTAALSASAWAISGVMSRIVATMKIARVPAANEKFELADVEIPEPNRGHVRVKVHACGVCHSDSLTVEGGLGNAFPRAPGHEVAGVVDAVGDGVSTWMIGDRVGVGWFGGCDFTCESCRRGDFINCERRGHPGIAYDGGYAEYMVAPARGAGAGYPTTSPT